MVLQKGLGLCCLTTIGLGILGCQGTIGQDLPGAGGPTAGLGGSSAVAGLPIAPLECGAGRAPLRRLTRFELNNTVRDLLGDATSPANALPGEERGNGFGNDADAQSVSSLLVEQYSDFAAGVAERATASPGALALLAPCAASAVDEATEQACARSFIEAFVPRAYRRAVSPTEVERLLALQALNRVGTSFAASVAAVVEAVLQSSDFLYRLEWGTGDAKSVRRPSGDEMATRLSYMFWGTQPDDALRSAASSGSLASPEGVSTQAQRLLDDPRSRPVIRFFFDNFLRIAGVPGLQRDATLFPNYNAAIGTLMHEETQRFLEHQIFQGPGSWASAFTADYSFMNGPLATFYGIQGVTGDDFRQVPLDSSRRLGFLTQAAMMAATTHSSETSPVVRGSFVVQKLMCQTIPLPTGDILAEVKPPEPYTGATARERYMAHSANAVCATCHRFMDPIGLALENFDPVGLWRDQENGVAIDASGESPLLDGPFSGPVALAQKLAASEQTHNCFATSWLNFAYGRTLGGEDDCTRLEVEAKFKESGYDIKKLLHSLTQTEAFLYLPPTP